MVFAGTLNDAMVAPILQNRCGNLSPTGSKLTPAGQTALNLAAGGTPQPWDSIFPSSGPSGALVAAIPTQCFDRVAVNLANQFLTGSRGSSSQGQDEVNSRDRSDQCH